MTIKKHYGAMLIRLDTGERFLADSGYSRIHFSKKEMRTILNTAISKNGISKATITKAVEQVLNCKLAACYEVYGANSFTWYGGMVK